MTTTANPKSKAKNIILWILQILVGAVFLAAGFSKLAGAPPMVEMFNQIGMGQWFRYVTGAIEIIAAILLFIPRLVPVGAVLLIGTMIGAALTHLVVMGDSPAAPIVLLLLAIIIAWGRKDRLIALIKRS